MPESSASGWQKASGETDAVNFERVFQKERGEIRRRRAARHADSEDVRTSLVGLAFSGGGIRSATFNLGVLQGLAELRLLRAFDYLSTVSGGGYIGSWLQALLRRARERSSALAPDPADDDGDIATAEEWLSPQGEESPAVGFLRRYSNYLTPRVGAFTADTWSLAVTYLRNTLLNLSLVVVLLAAALMAPRVAHILFSYCVSLPRVSGLVALGLVLAAATIAGWHIGAYSGETPPPRSWRYRSPAVVAGVAGPLLLATFAASASLSDKPLALWKGTLYGAAGYALAWLVAAVTALWVERAADGEADSLRPVDALHRFAYCVLAGLGAGALLSPLSGRLAELSQASSWELLLWGPPAVTALFILFGVVHIGLAGRRLPDEHREWLSRLAAWVLLLAGCWTLLVGLVVYGPALAHWLGGRLKATLSVGWLVTTLGGLLAGRSLERGSNGRARFKAILAELAPYVFVVGLLVLLAVGIDHALSLGARGAAPTTESLPPPPSTSGSLSAVDRESGAKVSISWTGEESSADPDLPAAIAMHRSRLQAQSADRRHLGFVIVGLVLLAGLFGARFDVNEFSMHHLYRNRLVRCYLGATLSPRLRIERAQPFTGFHPADDLPLHELTRTGTGPYPLINAAVNLVGGHQLAWQQRKAASFVFSPHFCGFETSHGHFGYRRTAEARPGQRPLTLGTALTISGAAVSPNMGYHSSPALAFLLTVFNLRLGMWLGNPACPGQWESPGPRFALTYLVREMLGLTTEDSPYVSLSDGGHFENLGLYELVRRRCRYIVVCDAGQDADLAFDDLANAIRKCRTDHGADIRLSLDSLRRKPHGKSAWHGAVGTVRYAPPRGQDGGKEAVRQKTTARKETVETGIVVYLKATLTGDEPEDVAGYAARESAFPHESTADQFFDESQFESYRMLGHHVAMSVFKDAVAAVGRSQGDRVNIPRLFLQLRQRWYPPAAGAVSFTEHTKTLDELFERARSSQKLAFLDRQFYLGWDAMRGKPPKHESPVWLPGSDDELRQGFYFCNSLIQLMENVYLDLHLESEHDHPDNRGWMNLFRQWSWSGMFRATWALSGSTYGQRFQTFSEQRLGLRPFDAIRVEPVAADELGKSALNPLERDVAAAFLEKQKDATVLALAAVVRDPVAKGDAGPLLAYPCGFAITVDEKLGCLRIQDHVRKMGLGRAALRELIQGARIKELSEELDLPTELSGYFPPTDRERLRELFRAVAAECRVAVSAKQP